MNWFQRGKVIWRKCSQPALVVLCFILLFLVLVVWKKPAKVITVTKDNLDLLREADSLRDLAGNRWSVLKAITVEKLEAQKRNDSLAVLLKLKPKFIKGQDIYITKSDTIFERIPVVVTKERTDTVYTVEKKDSYIDVVAKVGKNVGSISISSTDTLTRVEVVKNPLIGRTTRKIYLRNASPYNTITSGMSFTVKEKQPCLVVGPYVGVNYNGKPTAGIALSYPILIFKK